MTIDMTNEQERRIKRSPMPTDKIKAAAEEGRALWRKFEAEEAARLVRPTVGLLRAAVFMALLHPEYAGLYFDAARSSPRARRRRASRANVQGQLRREEKA